LVLAAGGPWQRLASGLVNACPKAAAAADGTVAIASAGRLYVRRGGTFAAPVKLGYDVDDLAVAPGGWVIAAGLQLTPHGFALMATTIAPDGARALIGAPPHPREAHARARDAPGPPRRRRCAGPRDGRLERGSVRRNL
jgi:hypothetical protein